MVDPWARSGNRQLRDGSLSAQRTSSEAKRSWTDEGEAQKHVIQVDSVVPVFYLGPSRTDEGPSATLTRCGWHWACRLAVARVVAVGLGADRRGATLNRELASRAIGGESGRRVD